MSKRIGIIGAGAAGLMAAGRASELGHDVTVFERNNRAARKLLITGKGRCNITNECPMDELLINIPGNGRFLHSSLNQFSNYDIIDFFNSRSMPVKTERGNRVFPVSDKSLDVADTLMRYATSGGAKFIYHARVKEITREDGRVTGVLLENNDFYDLDAVILATGGLSYPLTGSTGDGYAMAQSMGHTVNELKPSLVPLETKEPWARELQGLSLKNVTLSAFNAGGRKVYEELGEMLFTHFGVSGPLVLSASSHLVNEGFTGSSLNIDLKPALDEETLDKRIQRDFEKHSRKMFINSLDELLPKSMIPVFVGLSGIPEDKPVHQITKQERRNLVSLFKCLKLTVSKARPVDEAIITAGGISTKEINPKTMESKLVQGLFFAGEIIDVDAYTGGFNLTIAFSTGYTAASHV